MVRPAQISDASTIAAVHVQAWQDAYRGLLPDSLLENLSVERRKQWWSQTLKEQRPYSGLWVAEEEGSIVGFASWFRLKEGSDFTTEGELATIYLLRKAWDKGLGYQLYLAIEAEARASDCHSLGLWVLDSNQRGIGFYERVGFQVVPNKVKIDQANEIIMREQRYAKPLSPANSDIN